MSDHALLRGEEIPMPAAQNLGPAVKGLRWQEIPMLLLFLQHRAPWLVAKNLTAWSTTNWQTFASLATQIRQPGSTQ